MTIDIRAPVEQEGTKSVLKTWLKNVGDTVRADEPLVELETDKVAVEIAAPCDGTLAEIAVHPDDEVEPGMLLGRIDQEKTAALDKATAQSAAIAAQPAPDAEPATRAPLPPGIRKLLAEHGLNEGDVPMTGARLTREDIEAEAARRGGVTKVPHDSMRRRIAEHMVHSLTVAPHVTAVFEADFSAISAHRSAHKSDYQAKGATLTYSSYFVWAAARAMEAAPSVNGRWFDDRIEIYKDVNIGIGTALGDKGLVVPVIARAQALSLFEIAQRLQDLTTRARANALKPEDVRGGTFSISNHGTSGSLVAAPIVINQPQAAILGVGKLENRAVVRGDHVEIRPMAYVTLTIDHRMLDGHQTNAWLTRFVALLEGWPLEG